MSAYTRKDELLLASDLLVRADRLRREAKDLGKKVAIARGSIARLQELASKQEQDGFGLLDRAMAIEETFITRAGEVAQRLGANLSDLTFAVVGEAVRCYTGMDGRTKLHRSRLVPAAALDYAPPENSAAANASASASASEAPDEFPAPDDDDDEDDDFDWDEDDRVGLVEPIARAVTDAELEESAAYEAISDLIGVDAAEAWRNLNTPLNGNAAAQGRPVADAVTDLMPDDDGFVPASALGAMRTAAMAQGFNVMDNEIG